MCLGVSILEAEWFVLASVNTFESPQQSHLQKLVFNGSFLRAEVFSFLLVCLLPQPHRASSLRPTGCLQPRVAVSAAQPQIVNYLQHPEALL